MIPALRLDSSPGQGDLPTPRSIRRGFELVVFAMKTRMLLGLTLPILANSLVALAQQAGLPQAAGEMPAIVKKLDEFKFKQPSFTFVRVKYSGPMFGRAGAAVGPPITPTPTRTSRRTSRARPA
jgi:hypothetical protein